MDGIIVFQRFEGREFPPLATVPTIDDAIFAWKHATTGKHALAGRVWARSWKAEVNLDLLAKCYTGEHLRAVLSCALGHGL